METSPFTSMSSRPLLPSHRKKYVCDIDSSVKNHFQPVSGSMGQLVDASTRQPVNQSTWKLVSTKCQQIHIFAQQFVSYIHRVHPNPSPLRYVALPTSHFLFRASFPFLYPVSFSHPSCKSSTITALSPAPAASSTSMSSSASATASASMPLSLYVLHANRALFPWTHGHENPLQTRK